MSAAMVRAIPALDGCQVVDSPLKASDGLWRGPTSASSSSAAMNVRRPSPASLDRCQSWCSVPHDLGGRQDAGVARRDDARRGRFATEMTVPLAITTGVDLFRRDAADQMQ